jgi:hypothetical protein
VSSTTPRHSRRTAGPLRYYAPIHGHELVTRRELILPEPDHPWAGQWYYKLQLGPLEHKLPPIVANRWRRVTFIVITGDRFTHAGEIYGLFEQESPASQLYVRLKELGITVEREWWIDEEGTVYVVDLALPTGDGWLPVTFGDRPGATGGLRFAADPGLTHRVELSSDCLLSHDHARQEQKEQGNEPHRSHKHTSVV